MTQGLEMTCPDPYEAMWSEQISPEPFIRVTVIDKKGSAPREVGAGMTVQAEAQWGTIGGGQLEFEAIQIAQTWLAKPQSCSSWQRFCRKFALGPSLGQCCGGAVELLFEYLGDYEQRALVERRRKLDCTKLGNVGSVCHPLQSGLPLQLVYEDDRSEEPRRDQNACVVVAGLDRLPLFIYGAGHVGRALCAIMPGLPFAIHWVDTAAERFPKTIPPSVERVIAKQPDRIASATPAKAFHVVLTYSHAIDFAICHAILMRNSFGFLGLIGSETKAARFRGRLSASGVEDNVIAHLNCPVGLRISSSKTPAAVAVSIAAQLLAKAEQSTPENRQSVLATD
ncbi:MAG: xanthine dehydrogenase accessory protein XdhC [Hyphomicrobiaceae bacterium]